MCKHKDFCNVSISFKGTKISELDQDQKSDEAKFLTYADLECI